MAQSLGVKVGTLAKIPARNSSVRPPFGPFHFLEDAENHIRHLANSERSIFEAIRDQIDPPPIDREWYRYPGRQGYARPEQTPPDWDWLIWLILAGRGYGKTRTGAEWTAEGMLKFPGSFWIVGAPTFADGRDTCMEGESGLIPVLGGEDGPLIRSWNRSEGQLVLRNGSKAKVFSGEEPRRFRGPNARGAWLDELAVWKRLDDAWKMLRFTMRAGGVAARPQTVITTTPAMLDLLRNLLKKGLARVDDTTGVQDRKLPPLKPKGTLHLTLGKTFDNRQNLAATYLEEMESEFVGTRLGRQELFAEILDEVEGALWTEGLIAASRVEDVPQRRVLDKTTNSYVAVMTLTYIVVAVDPAVTAGRDSDAVGIVVIGLGEDNECYVLEDSTVQGVSPEAWGGAVIDAYERWQADEIVGEVNNGGDLVGAAVRTAAKGRGVHVRFVKVNATRGKRLRAEPVLQLYEQSPPKIHHVGVFPRLEDQMTTWVPAPHPGASRWSPDRLDALVWGVTRTMGLTPGSRRRRSGFTTTQEAA